MYLTLYAMCLSGVGFSGAKGQNAGVNQHQCPIFGLLGTVEMRMVRWMCGMKQQD